VYVGVSYTFNKTYYLSKKKNLVDATHQADRTEVFDLDSPHFLRDKSDERSIQTYHKFTSLVKLKKDFHDLFSENIPTGLEESHRASDLDPTPYPHSCLFLPQRPPFPRKLIPTK
jgi:hypothetical protein